MSATSPRLEGERGTWAPGPEKVRAQDAVGPAPGPSGSGMPRTAGFARRTLGSRGLWGRSQADRADVRGREGEARKGRRRPAPVPASPASPGRQGAAGSAGAPGPRRPPAASWRACNYEIAGLRLPFRWAPGSGEKCSKSRRHLGRSNTSGAEKYFRGEGLGAEPRLTGRAAAGRGEGRSAPSSAVEEKMQ